MHVVARIGKAHGLRGEVTIQVHTDAPAERFRPGAQFATEPDRGTVTVSSVRVHQQIYLLGFEGISDRTAAEALRNTRLLLAQEDTADEDEGWREEELLGLQVVTTDGAPVGEVSGLHTRPVQDLLQVRRPDGAEVLVPFVIELVPQIDAEAGTVTIDPPAGLLELGN